MLDRPSRFIVLLAIVGWAVAGCRIDSIHPISPAADAQPDTALYGAWRYQSKGDLAYVHIGPELVARFADTGSSPKPRMKIVIVDHRPNGLADDTYIAHVSRLGKQRYLNVLQPENGRTAGYILVRYAFAGNDMLRLSTIDPKALKSAIDAGRIRGLTRGEGLSRETFLTAESAEVANLLRSDADKLFTPALTLRRVREH